MTTTEEIQAVRHERDEYKKRLDLIAERCDQIRFLGHVVHKGFCYNFAIAIRDHARGGEK